jgi:pimeloyl-ACP methyl ester carboxylesterase
VSLLAHAIVEPERGASKTMAFLHGILGSGSNWRTFAKRLIESKPGWRAVLIDLRKHGASQEFDPPHTLAACANDIAELEKSIGRIDVVLGHSFGGKVALEYVFQKKDIEIAWILDSAPGARPDRRGSESTVQIVKMIGTLPERFDTREAFVEYVEKQGVERSIAMWLAMNVRQAPDGKGYVMRVDVPALRALLDDYFSRDLWSVVEDPARTTKVHMVAGGKSNVLDPGERARAQRNAVQWPDTTWLHVVPNAGHWVHVDAPNDLFDLVVHYT